MSEPSQDVSLRKLLEPLAEVPASSSEIRLRMRARLSRALEAAEPSSANPPAEPSHAPSPSSLGSSAGVSLTGLVAGTLAGVALGLAIGWYAWGTEVTSTPVEHWDQPSETSPAEEPRAPEPASALDRAPIVPQPAPAPDPSERVEDLGASSSDRPHARHHVQRQAPPTDDSTLQAERRLIDAAFAAWRQRNLEEAASFLDQHDREFAAGRLAPEREELRLRLREAAP